MKDFFSPVRISAVDQQLHVLGAISIRDQHRVGGLDNDQVLHPCRRDHLSVESMRQSWASKEYTLPFARIVVRVPGVDLPQGRPGADVAPAGSQGNHRRSGGFFHHRVVDGIAAAGREGLSVETEEVEILAPLRTPPGERPASPARSAPTPPDRSEARNRNMPLFQ